MTDASIFLVSGGQLAPLTRTPYETESILQEALARFPDVLAGPATAGEGGRLLLVSQEMPVLDAAGSLSMSLDHLFVDSQGVPVLVEVKRSTDTRIRREVVAQMIDYAANAVKYWPVERLRTLVEQSAATRQENPDGVLSSAFGEDIEPDRFWRTVEQNLRSGRVRLIFLADRLPDELVRVIEFLNEQMRDTEVLGVEVPQYTGAGEEVVYVPRVVGRTVAAADTKRGTAGTRWTQESLLEVAEQRGDSGQLSVLRRLLEHVRTHGGRFSWGTGATPGVTGWYPVNGKDTPVWNINLLADPSKAVLYFICAEFVTRQGEERTEAYGNAVAAIPGLAPRVEAARAKNWKGWLPMPLGQAVGSLELTEMVMNAIGTAIGDPSGGPL